jgi:peptidoglycan/xylan/chitin deacetylase (PgdA/CDA1 family)
MPKAIILMYHNIDNPPKGAMIPNLYVTPRMFKFQMWYLRISGFKVVSIREMLDTLSRGNLDFNMAAITFDDGYQDFYRNAYPVLKRYEYPSTVYVVTGLMGRPNVWDARNENHGKPLMDAKTILEISERGVEIGSHTKSHPELTRVSPAEQFAEIAESKKELEDLLDSPVDSFCYPGGDHNEQVKEAVKKAGYRHAVTTHRGHVEKGYDPFALRRIPIKLITNPFSFLYKIHTKSEKRKGKQPQQ